MRSRKEIENQRIPIELDSILEVLLDIRELLLNENMNRILYGEKK